MKPTDLLREEHRVIERVLDCLERMAGEVERNGKLDPEPARQAVDFFRNFADRCHHGKEEDQLFPMMEERGYSPDSGPTAVMRMEHEQGRDRIRAMENAIDGASTSDPDSCDRFVRNAHAYVAMLREHIQKEDHCLFPMADQALDPGDQTILAERFERVEREEIGSSTHETYRAIANDLVKRFATVASDV